MENLVSISTFKPKALSESVQIHTGAWTEKAAAILTPEVLSILTDLHRRFEPHRQALLATRRAKLKAYDAGARPTYNFDADSKALSGDWKVATIPQDLQTRRVEITGPVNSAKMVIQMLSRNAEGGRADTAMLDFEDSMKPSWANVVDGVHNVIGAAKGDLEVTEKGKTYRLDPTDMAVLMVRVRGLHLDESNLQIDGQSVHGGLFDLVLSFYHTAKTLMAQGKTPKYYVPKTEYHEEARWWNEVFTALETHLAVPVGTLKATFLIETLPAAFEMEEILYEIREHAAGLNVGRWDKIFSDIKVLKAHKDRIMGDRATITMKPETHWMSNYAQRLIKICHRRGAFAIGGMAAFTPGKSEALRAQQVAKVVADKQLEASIGHDGCWVSHPFFIHAAMAQFTRSNQLDVLRDDFDKYPDILPVGRGPYTMEGLRVNVRVGIAYQEGWNRDIGCVAWDNLMEDLATLEISRAQTWQWLHHGITLDCGTKVTKDLVSAIFTEELDKIKAELLQNGVSEAGLASFDAAAKDAEALFLQETFQAYLSFASDLAS